MRTFISRVHDLYFDVNTYVNPLYLHKEFIIRIIPIDFIADAVLYFVISPEILTKTRNFYLSLNTRWHVWLNDLFDDITSQRSAKTYMEHSTLELGLR